MKTKAKTPKVKTAKKVAGKPESSTNSRWTFLTNHTHVLALIHEHPDKILREVALEVGITERAVQGIIHDLEDAGYITREKIGRRNHYKVIKTKKLRHPIESHRKIGDLLQLISG